MTNKEIKIFTKGIHNLLPDTEIPADASSASINWITQDGRIKLAGGRQLVGTAGLVGKINALWAGYTVSGNKVLYRKTADAIQYYDGSDWVDTITSLTDAEISFANYSSLAGAFTLCNGPDGFWLFNNANPDSPIDLYSETRNFKGYILIDRGRCLLFNREKDKTGLYGSWIDRQDSTVYTALTAEAIGALGSTNYTGSLLQKTVDPRANLFAVTFTASVAAGTELFTDNYDGTLTSNFGGTGTINYMTGVYDITFSDTTTGAVTSDYQAQDFGTHGLSDFRESATRLAGEGFQFPQDEGGDAILNVLIGQDGSYYSLKEQSSYKLTINQSDDNATNTIYRKELGIPNWRAAISTSTGIVFMNTSNPLDPILTILRSNKLGDSIDPYPLCSHFDFSLYNYDDATVDTYERYVVISCKKETDDNNSVILMCNLADETVDVIKYEARMFAKDGIKLYCGSSISQDVYEILKGFDDEGLAIDNSWESKGENYGSVGLKKFKKLRLKGKIDPDQCVEVYGDLDDAGYSLLTTIDGTGSYVDYFSPETIGGNFIGSSQVGGDDVLSVYPFFCELKVKTTKFNKRKIKFVATGIGYVDIHMMTDFDILKFDDRMPKKYRVKKLYEVMAVMFGDDIAYGTEVTYGTEDGEMWAIFGNANVDGSWRLIVDGTDFIMQKRELGVWNNKQEYIP